MRSYTLLQIQLFAEAHARSRTGRMQEMAMAARAAWLSDDAFKDWLKRA